MIRFWLVMHKQIGLLLVASLVSGICSGAYIYLVFPFLLGRLAAEGRLFFSVLLGGLVVSQFVVQGFQTWWRR